MEVSPSLQLNERQIATEKARKAGAERRKTISTKLNSLFGGIREKITAGVDIVLGSPEAGGHFVGLATEEVKKQAIVTNEAVIQPVVEAGVRTWERAVDAKNRLVERARMAGEKLAYGYKQGKERTTAKVADLSRRAAVWGLTKVAEPIERRLEGIYVIPAGAKEKKAGKADTRAEKQAKRAELVQQTGEKKKQALLTQIAQIEEATRVRVESLGTAGESARENASELRTKAAKSREKAHQTFGKARRAVEALKTK